jgi:hypothetical protein
MGYTTENTQSVAVEAVLSTSEKCFAVASSENLATVTQPHSQTPVEVYFQIED